MKKLITLLFSLSLLCSSDLFLKTQASFITETRPSIQYEWKKDGKGWWYKNPDGSYPKNTWQKISGKWYHFDSKGYMQTGWLNDSGKWYALVMNIAKSKLDKKSDGNVEIVNMKIDEQKIQQLLKQEGFYPAYHMNKKYWITLVLDDSIKDDVLFELLDESHSYTVSKKKNCRFGYEFLLF